MSDELRRTSIPCNGETPAVDGYAYKGHATVDTPCTEVWSADTVAEAQQWEAELRAKGITDVRLDTRDARDSGGITYVHMRGTLKQALLHFGMASDLEEKVFQQFEDGSEGEYSGYWPAVVDVLMEWAAERGRQGLPATLKDI